MTSISIQKEAEPVSNDLPIALFSVAYAINAFLGFGFLAYSIFASSILPLYISIAEWILAWAMTWYVSRYSSTFSMILCYVTGVLTVLIFFLVLFLGALLSALASA